MATIIKIKRSQLAAAPGVGVLQEGELAYSQDRTGSGALAKLYIHSKNAAGAEVIHEIGGKYFTDIINAATNLATANTLVKRDATGSAVFNDLTVEGNLSVIGNQVITGNTVYEGTTTYDADVVFEGDIAVNGGDITSTAATFNFVNSGVSTLNIGGGATAIAVGGAATTTTFAGNVSIGGSLTVAQNATVGMDFAANTATITGDLMVDGNTTLGNDAAVDTTTIKGITTVQTSRTKAAAEAATTKLDAFKVVDSTGASLFQIKDNGDAIIGGVLTVSGTGTSTFAGDVSIGGSLTVAENATVTMGFEANDATITGNLVVNGNTTLGNDASDTTTITGATTINGATTVNGLSTVKTAVTKAAGNSTSDAFVVKSSDDMPLFEVKTNGDTVIAGVLTVNGTGTSYFAGDVVIGGSLTVQENATVTMDFAAEDATINGNLVVNGNTTLGNAAADTVSVVGTMTVAENATFSKNVTINGDLVVNGTTTTVNSTTTTLSDPVLSLAQDTSAADSFDRGIDFKWHNGTSVKTGFFGWDDSAEKFTFLKDATVTQGEYSGVIGDVVVGGVDASAEIRAKGGVNGFAADGTTRTTLANFVIENSVIDGGSY